MIKKKYILIYLLIIFLNITFLNSQINLINPKNNSTVINGSSVFFEWDNPSQNPVDLYYYNKENTEWEIIESNIQTNNYLWNPPNDLVGKTQFKLITDSYTKPNLIWEQKDAHNGEIREAVFTDDGNFLATIGADNRVAVWDIAERKKIDEIVLNSASNMRSVKFLDNEYGLFFTADNKIYSWDRLNNILEILYENPISESIYYYLDIDANKTKIACANKSNFITIIDLIDKSVYNSEIFDYEIYSCRFSPDGSKLAYTRYDGNSYIIDVKTKQILEEFSRHGTGSDGAIWGVDFIGQDIIATGSVDRTIKLWKSGNSYTIKTFDGHSSHVRSVKYSKNLNTILSGSLDSTIRQWSISKKFPIYSVTINHGGQVMSVGYSPTGDTLLSTGRDKAFRLWKNYKAISDTFEFSLEFKLMAKVSIPNYIYGVVGQFFDIPLELTITTNKFENEKFKANFAIEIPKLLVEPIKNATKQIPLDTLYFTFEANYKSGDIFYFPVLALQSDYYFDSVRIINFEIIENNIIEVEKENGSVILATECMAKNLRAVTISGENEMINISSETGDDILKFEVNFYESADYRISLYNSEGKLVKLFSEEYVLNGSKVFIENLSEFASGMYFIGVNWKNKSNYQKILLLR